jgi:acyl dehydratase
MGTNGSSQTVAPSGPRWAAGASGASDWFEVNQQRIDAFAAATGDAQWIHMRSSEIEAGPFGAPIAHGLLLLALAIKLARDCGAIPHATWVLYAFEKLRFRSPVRSGARIRCIVSDVSWRELGSRRLLDARLVIEIEHETAPALTTNCSLFRLDPKPGP